MGKVWLIRHGAVATGASDPGLSEVGLAQAALVASQLARRPLRAVWSSDLRRAMETAAAVAGRHALPVGGTAELREIDFGAWQGRALSDLWSEDPEGARAWEADIRNTPASFGETVADLERRVARFWSRAPAALDGSEVAVVAHRGSLAALRALITGGSFDASFAAGLSVGGCEGLDH